jgi:hypothetical protein
MDWLSVPRVTPGLVKKHRNVVGRLCDRDREFKIPCSWLLCILFLAFGISACQPDTGRVGVQPGQTVVSDRLEQWWQPATGLSWQWQLDGVFDASINADVYDIDLYEDQSVIDGLHRQGARVICYISVGSWENWRPDAHAFPPHLLGNDYIGWVGEKWLDIRRYEELAPMFRKRLDLCKSKGFDAVEPDNIDGYENDTGFPISYGDQFSYLRWLSGEAHARGLAIGLKNAPGMVADALPYVDFAITEDAFIDGWIGQMLPFIESGKPIFAAEYTDRMDDFQAACIWADEYRVDLILKKRDLTAFRKMCP